MRKYLPWLSGASGFAFTTAAILMHHVMTAGDAAGLNDLTETRR